MTDIIGVTLYQCPHRTTVNGGQSPVSVLLRLDRGQKVNLLRPKTFLTGIGFVERLLLFPTLTLRVRVLSSLSGRLPLSSTTVIVSSTTYYSTKIVSSFSFPRDQSFIVVVVVVCLLLHQSIFFWDVLYYTIIGLSQSSYKQPLTSVHLRNLLFDVTNFTLTFLPFTPGSHID